MSRVGGGGPKSAKKCHILFEWVLFDFEVGIVIILETLGVERLGGINNESKTEGAFYSFTIGRS
jgi:hypothetical protein